jgi:hypothetical protein
MVLFRELSRISSTFGPVSVIVAVLVGTFRTAISAAGLAIGIRALIFWAKDHIWWWSASDRARRIESVGGRLSSSDVIDRCGHWRDFEIDISMRRRVGAKAGGYRLAEIASRYLRGCVMCRSEYDRLRSLPKPIRG